MIASLAILTDVASVVAETGWGSGIYDFGLDVDKGDHEVVVLFGTVQLPSTSCDPPSLPDQFG